MNDRISIAYKEWLNGLNESAPDGAWDAIADQLDIDQTWDAIQQELDLEEVWGNVQQELPVGPVMITDHTPLRFSKFYWLVAIVILLTLTTPVPETENAKPIHTKISNQELVATSDHRSDHKEDEVSTTSTLKHSHAVPVPLIEKEKNKNKNKTSGVAAIRANETSRNDQLTQEPRHLTQSPIVSQTLDTIPQLVEHKAVKKDSANQQFSETVNNSENQRKNAGWSIGAIGSINNTWLVNNQTKNGLKSYSLINTQLSYGKEFGVFVQRQLGDHSSLQGELYFYSEINQGYQEYINVLYQRRDTELKYLKLQLIYRTKAFAIRNLPIYGLSGIHFSRLNSAHTSIGSDDVKITQQYTPWDYGLVMGVDTEILLRPNLWLIPGIRGSYGARNIYSGSVDSPSEFNKTHTASVGLSLAIKYRLK